MFGDLVNVFFFFVFCVLPDVVTAGVVVVVNVFVDVVKMFAVVAVVKTVVVVVVVIVVVLVVVAVVGVVVVAVVDNVRGDARVTFVLTVMAAPVTTDNEFSTSVSNSEKFSDIFTVCETESRGDNSVQA